MPIDAGGSLGSRIARLLRFAALAMGAALSSPFAHSDVLAKGSGSALQTPEQHGPSVAASQPSPVPPRLPDDLSLLAGISILNDFESEKGLAFGLDFHHPFSRVIDWDVAYLNEGHPGDLRRDGIVTELWLSQRYREDRLVLEFGAGLYGHADTGGEEDAPENTHDLGGIVSLSVRRSLSKTWFLRGTWHRVLGEHEDDTDVILVGIGHFLRKADHPPPAPAPPPVEPPGPTPEPSPPAPERPVPQPDAPAPGTLPAS